MFALFYGCSLAYTYPHQRETAAGINTIGLAYVMSNQQKDRPDETINDNLNYARITWHQIAILANTDHLKAFRMLNRFH